MKRDHPVSVLKIIYNRAKPICCRAKYPALIKLSKIRLTFSQTWKKCALCFNYGASVPCAASSCDQIFHYPCATSFGCYQDLKTRKILCPSHYDQAASHFKDSIVCTLCETSNRIGESLFCTTCGAHYHGSCLSPQIETNALVRVGWQCPECKICQVCKQTGDDTKTLVCDTCDKCAHSYCLKPDMMSVTATEGWNCARCRTEILTKLCTNCNGSFVVASVNKAKGASLCEDCEIVKGRERSPVNSFTSEKKRTSVKDLLLLSSRMQSLNGK